MNEGYETAIVYMASSEYNAFLIHANHKLDCLRLLKKAGHTRAKGQK